MDLNYNLNSDISLVTMCAVRVAQQILEAGGIRQRSNEALKETVMDAEARVAMLDLPRSIEEMIETLILPINSELVDWFSKFTIHTNPVMTPHGTVDVTESTRILLEDETLDNHYRYLVACRFCHVKHILRFGARLNADDCIWVRCSCLAPEMRSLASPLALFLLDAFQGQASEQMDGWLTQELCDESFESALRCQNDVALRYFIDKASPEAIANGLEKWLPEFKMDSSGEISPATYCSLFSKLTEIQRQTKLGRFSALMLDALLRWPYQRFFLWAARSLANHLSKPNYLGLSLKIVKKVAVGYKDCDYRELFIGFWELGANYIQNSGVNDHWCRYVILYALESKNEDLIDFVFGRIPAEGKEKLLATHGRFNVCATLIREGQSVLLESLIRHCTMLREDFLVKFRADVRDCDYFGNQSTRGEMEAARQRIVEIVDIILSEQPTDNPIPADVHPMAPQSMDH